MGKVLLTVKVEVGLIKTLLLYLQTFLSLTIVYSVPATNLAVSDCLLLY